MRIHSRTRKRVTALRRAPDGSAFETCENCGMMVAIALFDMHECGVYEKEVKRFKGEKGIQKIKVSSFNDDKFRDQPRSEYRFFMESFMASCDGCNLIDMDQKGFETWKTMSSLEKAPYVIEAAKVDFAYKQALLKAVRDMQLVDDKADSADVGKFDERYVYDDSEDGDSDYWNVHF